MTIRLRLEAINIRDQTYTFVGTAALTEVEAAESVELAGVVAATCPPDVVVGLAGLPDELGGVVACADPPQFVAVEPARALEKAPSMHDFAELAAACEAEGAIEISASAKSPVFDCKDLRSFEATSPRPAFWNAACCPKKAFREVMIFGIKELTAFRIEVASDSESVDVPFASVAPCFMDSSSLLSAWVTGTAEATSPLNGTLCSAPNSKDLASQEIVSRTQEHL